MKAHDTIRLPFAFSTPGIARTRLAAFLTVNRASNEVIDDALIVISEMIANAVSHGVPTSDGTIEISWAINGTLLELSVYDAGKGPRSSRSTSTRTRSAVAACRSSTASPTAGGSTCPQGTRVNAELGLTPH